MGTRAVIARAILEDGQYTGKFVGVYHHWDGYPTGLGLKLIELLNGKFKGNLEKMLTWVIDTHSAGWSTLHGTSDSNYKPVCYCHPKKGTRSAEKKGQYMTQADDCGAEWNYVFDTQNGILYVVDVYAKITTPIVLGNEINWQQVECGANFERCKHVADFHVKDLPEQCSRMSMSKWLGYEALQISDAIAVVVRGRRYEITGSGHSHRYRKTCTVVNENAWISTVFDKERGVSLDLPTHILDGFNYLPYPGVQYIMPPTKLTCTGQNA